jgi:hypothetical protein
VRKFFAVRRKINTHYIKSALADDSALKIASRRIGPALVFERLWEETGCRIVIAQPCGASSRFVFFGPLADAEDLAKSLQIDRAGHQQRNMSVDFCFCSV